MPSPHGLKSPDVGVRRASVVFLIINRHADPGSPHDTHEACFEVIDGMVRDGLAEPGEFWVIEHDEHGRAVGEPFPAPSGLEHARTTATWKAPARS